MGRITRSYNASRQLRSGNGKFREFSFEKDLDIGIIVCPDCGTINTWSIHTFEVVNGFVDPRRNPPPTNCYSCGALLKEDDR